MQREREDDDTSAAPSPMRRQRRHDGLATSSSDTNLLSLLPTSLVHEHIFAFFATPALLSAPKITTREFVAQLQPLRGVCRQWETVVRGIRDQVHDWKHTLDFQRGDDEEFQQLLSLAEATGLTTQHLEVAMGVRQYGCMLTLCQPHRELMINHKTEALDALDWPLLFSKFPNIVRLDLSVTLIQHLPVILKAACVACPRVQVLILPYAQSRGEPDAAELTRVLRDALQHWRECNGGLQFLQIPYWPTTPTTLPDDLFAAIVAYCPRMQRLEGWRTHSETRRAVSMSPEAMRVFAVFCSTCLKHLRAYDWKLMCLNQSTLALFNATAKPRLEKLVVDEQWTNTADQRTGNGDIVYTRVEAGLEMIESMLAQTPALNFLRISVHDHAMLKNRGNYRGVTTTAADALVLALVNKCPRLQEFHYNMSSPERDAALTGTAIVALVGLRSVKNLVLERVVFQATSLADVVQEAFARKRVSALIMELAAADAAHGSLCDLLAYLAANPSLWSESQAPFNLEVSSDRMKSALYPSGVPRADPIPFDDLKRLFDGIDARYAGQRIHVRLEVYSDEFHMLQFVIRRLRLRVNDPSFKYPRNKDQGVCVLEIAG